MPLQDTNPCSITYEVLCHCERKSGDPAGYCVLAGKRNKHAAQRHVTNCFFDQTIAVNVICLSFACLFLFPTSTIVSCGGSYANSRRTPTQSVGVLATGHRNHKKRQPKRLSYFYGAGGRTRTGTVSLPVDFESTTSANSITPAQIAKS